MTVEPARYHPEGGKIVAMVPAGDVLYVATESTVYQKFPGEAFFRPVVFAPRNPRLGFER